MQQLVSRGLAEGHQQSLTAVGATLLQSSGHVAIWLLGLYMDRVDHALLVESSAFQQGDQACQQSLAASRKATLLTNSLASSGDSLCSCAAGQASASPPVTAPCRKLRARLCNALHVRSLWQLVEVHFCAIQEAACL